MATDDILRMLRHLQALQHDEFASPSAHGGFQPSPSAAAQLSSPNAQTGSTGAWNDVHPMQRSAMPQHDPQLRGGRAATPACSSSSRSASSVRRLTARAMLPASSHGKLLALVRHQSQRLKDQELRLQAQSGAIAALRQAASRAGRPTAGQELTAAALPLPAPQPPPRQQPHQVHQAAGAGAAVKDGRAVPCRVAALQRRVEELERLLRESRAAEKQAQRRQAMAMEAARSTAQTCGAAQTQLQLTRKVAEVTGADNQGLVQRLHNLQNFLRQERQAREAAVLRLGEEQARCSVLSSQVQVSLQQVDQLKALIEQSSDLAQQNSDKADKLKRAQAQLQQVRHELTASHLECEQLQQQVAGLRLLLEEAYSRSTHISDDGHPAALSTSFHTGQAISAGTGAIAAAGAGRGGAAAAAANPTAAVPAMRVAEASGASDNGGDDQHGGRDQSPRGGRKQQHKGSHLAHQAQHGQQGGARLSWPPWGMVPAAAGSGAGALNSNPGAGLRLRALPKLRGAVGAPDEGGDSRAVAEISLGRGVGGWEAQEREVDDGWGIRATGGDQAEREGEESSSDAQGSEGSDADDSDGGERLAGRLQQLLVQSREQRRRRRRQEAQQQRHHHHQQQQQQRQHQGQMQQGGGKAPTPALRHSTSVASLRSPSRSGSEASAGPGPRTKGGTLPAASARPSSILLSVAAATANAANASAAAGQLLKKGSPARPHIWLNPSAGGRRVVVGEQQGAALGALKLGAEVGKGLRRGQQGAPHSPLQLGTADGLQGCRQRGLLGGAGWGRGAMGSRVLLPDVAGNDGSGSGSEAGLCSGSECDHSQAGSRASSPNGSASSDSSGSSGRSDSGRSSARWKKPGSWGLAGAGGQRVAKRSLLLHWDSDGGESGDASG